MAKKYHQSRRDRMHESAGMHAYEKESHGGKMDPRHYKEHRRGEEPRGDAHIMRSHEYYAGMEPRRRQEMEDAGMIHEDHRAIANLPQNVMIKEYPKAGPYMPEGLDDTIAGVDRQMDYDDEKRAMNFYPKKV